MKWAAVLNVYIKRMSNLILLSQQNPNLSLMELKLALTETLSYLELAGIETELILNHRVKIKSEKLIALYTFFQENVETYYAKMSALKVSIAMQGEQLMMSLEMKGPGIESKYECMEIKACKGEEDPPLKVQTRKEC